jgi:predicted phage tail protein
MKTIHLHGDLASFGGPFLWEVRSAPEAVRALASQLPGFRQRLSHGSFHVISGPIDGGMELDEDTLTLINDDSEIHFVPAIEGAGSDSPFVKILTAAALITAGLIIGPEVGFTVLGSEILVGEALISIGVSAALAGIGQLLSPVPAIGSNESPDKRESFLFNQQINRQEAGAPVPLVFGKWRGGSVVGAAGMAVEEVPLQSDDGTLSDKFLDLTP